MAHTSDNLSGRDYRTAIFISPKSQTTVWKPVPPAVAEFNQWWHEMTEDIRSGRVMFSVQEQIKHDQLAGVSNDISVLADLEDDWDAEGASAVNVTCIAEAKSFITLLECEATNERSEWILPTVNPTVDGGLQLYWFTPWGQTAITFRSGRQEVEVQRKQLNETGEFRSVPVTEAVKIAVRAMRGA